VPPLPNDATAALIDRLRRSGVVPVVTVQDIAVAPSLVTALVGGGLAVVEITLRTAAGIEALRTAHGLGAVLGAGTVTTAAEATMVIEAGAQFVVSPGLDEGAVRTCQEAGVPIVPGVATPSEIMAARALGLRAVKVFPASSLGGPAFVSALSSVWPDMTFMPTGGISVQNAGDYLAIPSVAAVGGSWMVPSGLIGAYDWDAVTDLARGAAALAEVRP
jgi:2-dehydro-3-deoxyphosphogluconate aldolase/(4S)-4-hydroxy-2-oxoglutarate aldolase